jgi:LytR cell envelope-related transcriptional attenuator
MFDDVPPPQAPPPMPADPPVAPPAASPPRAANPYVTPTDPAAIAAEHAAMLEVAAAPRVAGAHRARRGPMRYVLPALGGALVVVLVGVGIAGWLGRDTGSTTTGTPPVHSTVAVTQATPTPTPTSASPTPSHSAVTSPQPTPRPSASASHPAPLPPPLVHAPVVVLNETTIHGLAARVALHLRSLGWTVTGVGNWVGEISTSTVYYPPGMTAAARRLAYDLGIGRIRPCVPGMVTDRLTVVLRSDPLS